MQNIEISLAYARSCDCGTLDTIRLYGSLRRGKKGRKSKRFGVFDQIDSMEFRGSAKLADGNLVGTLANWAAAVGPHFAVLESGPLASPCGDTSMRIEEPIRASLDAFAYPRNVAGVVSCATSSVRGTGLAVIPRWEDLHHAVGTLNGERSQ